MSIYITIVIVQQYRLGTVTQQVLVEYLVASGSQVRNSLTE